MKPSDTAITRIAAAIPRTGCLNLNTRPPLWLDQAFCAGMIPQRIICQGGRLQQEGRGGCVPRPCSAIQKRKLLIARTSGKNFAIRHRDLCLTNSIRVRLLGTDAADLHLVSDLQRVRSPALAKEAFGGPPSTE